MGVLSTDNAIPGVPDGEVPGEIFAGSLPREEEPAADDSQKKLVEAFNEEQDRKTELRKNAPGVKPAAQKPWLSSSFDASAAASLPSKWQDLGDKIRMKKPDAEKMEGRRYRRKYEEKLDQMLIYAIQNKGWDSLCLHDRRGRVDGTMTHLLAERRAVLLGTPAGQKKLKAAGFTEEDVERLRALHISHTRLPKPDKKVAGDVAPPAAPLSEPASEPEELKAEAGALKKLSVPLVTL
jgi:hypothetical protein